MIKFKSIGLLTIVALLAASCQQKPPTSSPPQTTTPPPVSGPVSAGTFEDFLFAIAMRESNANPNAANTLGYLGMYQMGEIAMVDVKWYKETPPNETSKNDWTGAWLTGAQNNAVSSKGTFLGNAPAQNVSIKIYYDNTWKYIKNLHLNDYEGQIIDGEVITRSGLLAGWHLLGGVGLKKFLQSNGTDVPSDAYGTLISEYVTKFGGYDTPY